MQSLAEWRWTITQSDSCRHWASALPDQLTDEYPADPFSCFPGFMGFQVGRMLK